MIYLGTLTNNLGLDIVVVVTKTDYIQNLEKEQDYRDEHLDFMQQWIRRFCLQYGAALFYTSAKEDKNCDLLYKYLTHRIYGFPFHTPALVVEKDAVFIPAGWDNMKKISILYENMHSCKPDDYYRDVIVQPAMRKTVNRESEILAEDEQTFLTRQQQISFGGGPPAMPRLGDTPSRLPLAGEKNLLIKILFFVNSYFQLYFVSGFENIQFIYRYTRLSAQIGWLKSRKFSGR